MLWALTIWLPDCAYALIWLTSRSRSGTVRLAHDAGTAQVAVQAA